MELHPLCTLFPRLEGKEFEALVADIKANGLRNPIIVYEGMILDGGNRDRACREAGVIAEYEEFTGADPASYVLSVNLHRRHMSAGQQAAAVAAAQDWTRAQGHGGDRKSGQLANLPLAKIADRAAVSGASPRTQWMADKVARADPELVREVARGNVSLPDAVLQVEGAVKKKGKEEEKKDELAEAFSDTNPVEEWERTQKELEAAQATIDSLTKDDTKAELKRQIDARKAVEQRLSAEMTRCGALDKELRAYGKWAKELREITGCESRSDITRAVRDAVRIAKDSVEL